MKRFILFARHCAWTVFAIPSAVVAQGEPSFPNYVVIGAFAHHNNAIHFTDDANRHDFPATFEMNPNRNLYYVYVMATPDREMAVEQALKLRTETKYFDTWVYCGILGEFEPGISRSRQQDFDPVTGRKMESVQPDATERSPDKTLSIAGKENLPREETQIPRALVSEKESITASGTGQNRKGKEKNDDGIVTQGPISERDLSTVSNTGQQSLSADQETTVSDPDTAPGKKSPPGTGERQRSETQLPIASVEEKPVTHVLPPKRTSDVPLTTEEVAGKNFFFSLFRADNHEVIEGEVDAIDFQRSRRMATYPANIPVEVKMPSGKSNQVSFLCKVFGYRQQQKEFDPADPSDDIYLDENGNLVVPFELIRLQKGDIAIMYNVFFFKDAAVMRPESRYEVNNLLQLLVENPDYKIRIHGHTNGNAAGKIIRIGKSENFYSLTETKEGFGSAKKLSEERADVIRQYLVSSGVGPERMEIKAWGGKKPLYDKNSVRAVENVRVEIEILSH